MLAPAPHDGQTLVGEHSHRLDGESQETPSIYSQTALQEDAVGETLYHLTARLRILLPEAS